MSESPVDLLRRAAEAAPKVLPAWTAEIVSDYMSECADAVERGSAPQGVLAAHEVLALAEQAAPSSPGEDGGAE